MCKGQRYWYYGATFEILVSQGSPWKKGLSHAPCPWAILMPESQSWSSSSATQHCSWAILEISGRHLTWDHIQRGNLYSVRKELDKGAFTHRKFLYVVIFTCNNEWPYLREKLLETLESINWTLSLRKAPSSVIHVLTRCSTISSITTSMLL